MKAYKFLAAGGVGRFSDHRWPPPGEWVEAEAPLRECTVGIHACRVGDLLDWVDDELWEVELDRDVREAEGMLVAQRGRLVRRVDAWTPALAAEFAEACTERARGHALAALKREGLTPAARKIVSAMEDRSGGAAAVVGYAADAVALAGGHRPDTADVSLRPAVVQSPAAIAANVAFVVAHTAGSDAAEASGVQDAYASGFGAERAWQLVWLTERLGLDARA